jgi:hypothetical protein
VRAINGRGFGIVATTLINAGDLLVSERAAVRVHPEEVVGDATNSMSLLLTERLILAIESDAVLRHRIQALEGYQAAYEESLTSSSNIDVAIFHGASAVCSHNAITINNNNTDDSCGGGEGLWVYCARFNHSCAPSARWHINATDEILYIRAAVDIAAGDEVTISYGPGEAVMYCEKKRAALMMKTWGFICDSNTCRLCAGQRCADSAVTDKLSWVATPGPMPELFRVRLRRGSANANADVAAYLLSAESTLFNERKRVKDLKLLEPGNVSEPPLLNIAFFHAASLLFTGAAFFEEKHGNLQKSKSLWKQVIELHEACPALLCEESARAAECLARTSIVTTTTLLLSNDDNGDDNVDWIAMAARLRGKSEEGGGTSVT